MSESDSPGAAEEAGGGVRSRGMVHWYPNPSDVPGSLTRRCTNFPGATLSPSPAPGPGSCSLGARMSRSDGGRLLRMPPRSGGDLGTGAETSRHVRRALRNTLEHCTALQ